MGILTNVFMHSLIEKLINVKILNHDWIASGSGSQFRVYVGIVSILFKVDG
jgi:hypothetical protein